MGLILLLVVLVLLFGGGEFLYGPSIPLFWRGPQHNIGDRHYSPSVERLICPQNHGIISQASNRDHMTQFGVINGQTSADQCPLAPIADKFLSAKRNDAKCH